MLCPTYADIAENGDTRVAEVVYERSVVFAMARYMTLQVKRREYSLPLLKKLLRALLKRFDEQLINKAYRAVDNLSFCVGKAIHTGGISRKRVAGFNLPVLYVGDGNPINLNIDLMLSEVKTSETSSSSPKFGLRLIIYHLDPDREPSKVWLLYNPRVMGTVCLASDLMSTNPVLVDVISAFRKTVYRLDLTPEYIDECKQNIHRLGRQMTYGILGKNATRRCRNCPCRGECERRGTTGKNDVRKISEISTRVDGPLLRGIGGAS